ncbi:MAG: hypothetical protein IPG56_13420 [Caulobacteraceae bacterium]|nr:hypothetical protein [Caulobacteraceae bacterium]
MQKPSIDAISAVLDVESTTSMNAASAKAIQSLRRSGRYDRRGGVDGDAQRHDAAERVLVRPKTGPSAGVLECHAADAWR